MPYQTSLLEGLRDWGLPVIEVNNWRTRGRSTLDPRGAVNHHTAGARRGKIPSLNILVNGRSDLPGPLCNVAQSRSTEFDPSAKYDEVYLVAAGRANHAGSGGWKGLKGNSSVFGLEIEHVGDLSRELWPERRQHTAYRIHAALAEVGGYPPDMIAQHAEWTSRKIDFVEQDGHAFRSSVTETLRLGREEEEDMKSLVWFKDKKGGTHAYLIHGVLATHVPTQESLDLLEYLGTPWAGSKDRKDALGPEWYRSTGILTGPLKNV